MRKKISHELLLALSFMAILLILLLPLSPFFLDLMLALNLALSLMTLFITISVSRTLEFSTFPSLLLFLTFFRLSLNIASTRMILSKGEAGSIIDTFGNFVTMGNTLIGFVIFALLTVINFIVITKGAGRIAEVAARFTLEALPGKQAAIDAELATGHMNSLEAKEARIQMGQTAEFYGAMDGASKFVRGDAIASLVIILVNVFGGVIVGMISGEMSIAECLATYTRLTIGDGLVTQIPALLISLSGALMVSRASEGSLASQLAGQLVQQPKILAIGGGALLLLSLIPGMPKVLMLIVSLPFLLYPAFKKKQQEERVEKNSESSLPPSIEILLGMKCLSLAEGLLPQVTTLGETITHELGVQIPSIHLRDDLTLPSDFFQLKIKGASVYKGRGEMKEILYILHSKISAHAHTFLNRQEVSLLLEKAKVQDAAVVEELIPKKLQLGDLLKVLQNLLREGFRIVDFTTILETLADHVPRNEIPDPDMLTECVRQKFSAQMLERLLEGESTLHAITLDPKVEQMLSASIKRNSGGATLSIRPLTLEKIEKEIMPLLNSAEEQKLKAVVLAPVSLRRHLSRLLERHQRTVLSYEEVESSIEIKSFGTISTEVLI